MIWHIENKTLNCLEKTVAIEYIHYYNGYNAWVYLTGLNKKKRYYSNFHELKTNNSKKTVV